MNKIPKKYEYNWFNFDEDVIKLATKISEDWMPDYVAGVKRGGIIPAVKLSHLLGKPLIVISCQLRDNEDREVKLLEAEKLPKNKKILVVDDICDSGETFDKIAYKLKSYGFNEIKCCSLFYNESQAFLIDFKANLIDRSKDDRWIVFPWE
jgi:hypoxanthine phosphoribosyltransferase